MTADGLRSVKPLQTSIMDHVRSAAIPMLCWLALWGSLNTGPWNLTFDSLETSWTGLFNAGCAALPLLILGFWAIYVMVRANPLLRRPSLPEALWLYYAVATTISTAQVEPWFENAYWGFSYLAAFAAIEMYMSASASDVDGAASLNRFSWLIAGFFLLMIVATARGSLLQPTPLGLSGYDVSVRMPTVAGMAMVRSSGISRWAAIPAIIAAASIFESHGLRRLFWCVLFCATAFLVWSMQSRGSLTSLAAALLVVMLFAGRKARPFVVVALLTLIVTVAGDLVSQETLHHLWAFAARNQSWTKTQQMSGRVYLFRDAWQAILQAPFIGYGWQADRRVIGSNAQNGVLYALLCGGFLGASGFVAGLLVSWAMLWQALFRRSTLPPEHRKLLTVVAGLFTFFTVRLYPENAAAVFSVDLLVQLPAIVYIGALDRAVLTVRFPLKETIPARIAV
jgi:O-antigen ligase